MTKRRPTTEPATLSEIVRQPIGWFKPFPNNPRTHPPDQVKAIRAAMEQFDWTIPILADADGEVIAGHGRLLAAQLEPALVEAPTIIARGWTEAQKRAYRIADNKLSERGVWNQDMLRAEIGELQIQGFDLSITGFSVPELAAMRIEGYIAPQPERGDEIPKRPINMVVKPGDLWTLGDHRLLVADNTKPNNVSRLMNGKPADLLFTSPPYAQQRDYGVAKEQVSAWDKLMQGTFTAINGHVHEKTQLLVNLGLVHQAGEVVPYWEPWIAFMREHGWKRFGWYCWDQGPGLPGIWHGRLGPAFEFIFHFNMKARLPNKTVDNKSAGSMSAGVLRSKDGVVRPRGPNRGPAPIQAKRIPDSVIRIQRHKGVIPGDIGSHPAIFPVQLPREIIGAYTIAGEAVYDPFVGSGTTLIACEQDGRRGYAMEIDPAYAQIVIERWQNFTNKKASREDGKSLASLAKKSKRNLATA